MTIHYFESSKEAYDACLTGTNWNSDEEVEIGDIVVVKSERIVALCDTWPVVVTKAVGYLHDLKDGHTIEGYFATRRNFPMDQISKARQLAAELNFE